MDYPFISGELYRRRLDIHSRFRGQQQGGISTPKGQPFIFLFTGEGGSYGYHHDGVQPDGVYHYTGEGQRGDMKFAGGNKAIRDHLADGKDLLLFTKVGKFVRFENAYSCTSFAWQEGLDVRNRRRKVIVFHLVPADGLPALDSSAPASDLPRLSPAPSLADLRQAALAAASAGPSEANGKQGKRTYYERSKAVRDYVLARAAGICESCVKPAPFIRRDGSPYLEPHHIRRRSDGGPDHPMWVGAICPTCHSEIHYGVNGVERNKRLEATIRAKQ